MQDVLRKYLNEMKKRPEIGRAGLIAALDMSGTNVDNLLRGFRTDKKTKTSRPCHVSFKHLELLARKHVHLQDVGNRPPLSGLLYDLMLYTSAEEVEEFTAEASEATREPKRPRPQ